MLAQAMSRIRKKQRDIDSTVSAKEVQVRMFRESLARYRADIEALETEDVRHQKVLTVFKQVTDERAEGGKEMLVNVLNWALANVPLEQRYEASIEEGTRGNHREFSIVLRDLDTGFTRNLRNQSGTALVQIISFLMNVIVIILSNANRFMVLDECFSGLQDQETITMFGEILVALARNEQFQFVMVEHKSELHTVEGITQIYATLHAYEEGVQFTNTAS